MLIQYLVTKDIELVNKLDAEGLDYFQGPDGLFYFLYAEDVYADFDLNDYEFAFTERVCF